MPTLPDIQTQPDIRRMVDAFYGRVQADKLLGPIFNDIAKVNWAKHLPIMYTFWGSLLLNEEYRGQAFAKHAPLPIGKAHFERWLALFNENLDSLFAGPKAEEAKMRARSIALVFNSKMEHLAWANMPGKNRPGPKYSG